MTNRATNHTATWSTMSMAAKQAKGSPNIAADRIRKPMAAMIRGRNGPTNRMPAPASDAFSPIAQLERPYPSSASEKYG